jgi:hypothetical protein
MNMLPTVRRQLVEAVERRAQPAWRATLARRLGPRRRRRPTAAHIAIAALCAVPVVIAAGALVLLGAHRAAPTPPAQARPETARQQLIDQFAVLRRPQTPADRDSRLLMAPFLAVPHRTSPGFTQLLRQLGYPKLDQALMRVVRVPRFDAKVAFEPLTWQPYPSSPRRSEGLELVLWLGSASTIPPSSEDGTGPTAVPSLLAHGLALADARRNNTVIEGVVVVPDRVAKVTVRPIRLLRTPVQVDASTFGAATAAVRDNVAAFELRLPTVHSPRFRGSDLFGSGAQAEVTWFDASGKVIKRTTMDLDVFIRVVGRRA